MNVFLGLGLPWVIAAIWEKKTNDRTYYVPSDALGFSVVLFLICALFGLIILAVRRKVVGGELGGSKQGRLLSSVLLTIIWAIYLLFSILQTLGVAGLDKITFGIDRSMKHPDPLCNK